MVRYIYSFVVGMLFLNLQAYGMVDDMGGAEPEKYAAARARAIQVIQTADRWEHFGSDFGKMLDKNAAYFLIGLKLDVGVWKTFTDLYSSYKPSETEYSEFDQIQGDIIRIGMPLYINSVFNVFERAIFGGENRPMPRPAAGPLADLKAQEPRFIEVIEAQRSYYRNRDKYETQQSERLARQQSERLARQESERLARQEKERLLAELRADNSWNKGILDFFTLGLPDPSELTDWRR